MKLAHEPIKVRKPQNHYGFSWAGLVIADLFQFDGSFCQELRITAFPELACVLDAFQNEHFLGVIQQTDNQQMASQEIFVDAAMIRFQRRPTIASREDRS